MPSEFDSHLLPIFVRVLKEAVPGTLELNLSHFLSTWQSWMTLGIARTWEVPGAVLGALFTHDVYSGKPRALLMFWLSDLPARVAGRTIALLDQFECAGKEFGATRISVAQHRFVSPEKLAKVYLKRGYQVSELIFSKDI